MKSRHPIFQVSRNFGEGTPSALLITDGQRAFQLVYILQTMTHLQPKAPDSSRVSFLFAFHLGRGIVDELHFPLSRSSFHMCLAEKQSVVKSF